MLWHTEGKGDEDMAVHEFWRRDADDGRPLDPRRPERFSTTLPNSPLSYDGQIVKVRWCVRVRVFPHRGKEIVGEKGFQLGDVPPSEPAPSTRAELAFVEVIRTRGRPARSGKADETPALRCAVHHALRTLENPFCTRRVRPGAIPFLFPAGEDAETLVGRLRQNGWWGEIVGAHGTGKSALLATLIPRIELAGRQPLLVELHDGQRRLPLDLDRDSRLRPPTLLVVDGYEQLSRWRRWLLKRLCRRRGWGLWSRPTLPSDCPNSTEPRRRPNWPKGSSAN